MDAYLETKVNPLLEEMVTLLLTRRPEDPVPFLIEFLQAKEMKSHRNDASSISHIINAMKDADKSPVLQTDEDEEVLCSPTSTGLLSPSHSPSNIAKYFERGARISVSGTPTDDIIRKYANPDAHEEQKSDLEIAFLVNLLTHTSLAAGRTEAELIAIAQELEKIVFDSPGLPVELNASILVVESGQIEKISDPLDDVPQTIFGPGDVLGDVSGMPHCDSADITKLTTVSDSAVCWKLSCDFFDFIVRTSAINRREKHMQFLSSVPILSSMDSEELFKICDAIREEKFQAGQYIVHQGEPGNVFYIVESGTCLATRSYVPGQVPTEVMKYGSGDYFGELSLLHNEPRDANVIAVVDTSVISLDRKSFKRLLGPIENILQRNSSVYQDTVSLL